MNELIKMITQLGSPTLFFVFYTKGHQMLSMIVFTKCCDFSEGDAKAPSYANQQHRWRIQNIITDPHLIHLCTCITYSQSFMKKS